jgi:hypothetical protein
MTVAEAGGLLGLIFGVVGTTLEILNYLRDRACIQISLKWDMSVTDNPLYDPNKLWGCIWVGNVGRRPIFISHVALRLPKGFKDTHLVLNEGISGVRLAEGDPTKLYIASQAGLEQYAAYWKEIVAQVSDATGRVWTSRRLRNGKAPSWAK